MDRKGLFANCLLASTLVLASTLFLSCSAHAQQPAPIPPPETCKILLNRLDDLIAVYIKAADAAIAKEDPAPALERARKAAQKGDAQATVTMAGITIQMRSRAERYTVPTIRQICTLADRNGLPLHLVTCAYLNALNPIGNREEKRAAMLRMLSRFDELDGAARQQPDIPTLAGHVQALRQCTS
jgi:hypothetical protein